MSQSIDDAAMDHACPSCGAGPGDWCVTFRPTRHSPGRRAGWLHTARTASLYEMWSEGYHEGQKDVADMVGRGMTRLSATMRTTVLDAMYPYVRRMVQDAIKEALHP